MVKDCCGRDGIPGIAAILANLLQIGAAVFIAANSYSQKDVLFCLLLLVAPALSLLALRRGPDREERRLSREVRKARLRRELEDLQK